MRIVLLVLALAARAAAQPPNGPPPNGGANGPPPNGGGGGGPQTTAYKAGVVPQAAGLRGTIGTVDKPQSSEKTLIYGPFEAGFSAAQTKELFGCTAGITIEGGLDTLTAEQMVIKSCNLPSSTTVLDSCGGHATPYHYHERMSCLYSSDPATGHSTRIGTMLDGNGLYGKYVAKEKLPTDLDACGGRKGVTPDSGGKEVYYYMVQDKPPFTVGCWGPVRSLAECRALYSTCGDGDAMSVTTGDGTRDYDPDCPCFEPSSGPGGVTNIASGAGSTGAGSTGAGSTGAKTAGTTRMGVGAASTLLAALLAGLLSVSAFRG